MSELAVAAFAAALGCHLLDEPRTRRFERFRRSFDEAAYRRELELQRRSALSRAPTQRSRPCCARSTIRRPVCSSAARCGLGLLGEPSVAVVGARACSAYGTAVATELARELAAAGVVVVSGLARGVDAAAHRGALDRAGEHGRRASAAASTATTRAPMRSWPQRSRRTV